MEIRAATPEDLPLVAALLSRIDTFTREELACARELVELALKGSPDYRVLVAEKAGNIVGYVCFGPTPMTQSTWDLYWIASAPSLRGKGVGSRLLVAVEELVREGNIRVETSSESEYERTRHFYDRHGYREASRLRDFYKPGDDLVTLYKAIPAR